MDGVLNVSDGLLKSAASRLRGTVRHQFLAEVCEQLCAGNAREVEYRFGWGRETVAKGMEERRADNVVRACAQRMTWKGEHPQGPPH